MVAPGPQHWPIFVDLCKKGGAAGNLVPDAYLAALAIESGSEWITTDRDYSRFPRLRWKHPFAIRGSARSAGSTSRNTRLHTQLASDGRYANAALEALLVMLGLVVVTIAISLKVNDGIVLASDSATTVMAQPAAAAAPVGPVVLNVYNNANKIVNLYKGLPIGAMTWGFGSIGPASISSLMKDLRARFCGNDARWCIEPGGYTIADVAEKFRRFFFEELYEPQFRQSEQKPNVGFVVAGYSAGAPLGEEYQIDITNGRCDPPRALREDVESGLMWAGMPEAITRLIMGYGTGLPAVLQANLGVPPEQIQPAMTVISQLLQVPLVIPAMPIQDAVDLAEFLVETTIKFSRFMPGAPTVGGPVEVAAITKHEGFKWVRRKHYYSQEFNRS